MASRPVRIVPSILSADFARLGEEVKAADAAGGDWIHVDVMDGHFVPNLTVGPLVVEAIRPLTDKPLDVHLMISPADPFIEAFATAGADRITLHPEAGPHLDRSLEMIRGLGKKAGVAIDPATPVSLIADVLDRLDQVLIMSVNPGFGGQQFIPQALEKLRQADRLIGERSIELEVDGGISADNAGQVAAAGGNVFVAGSAVFAGNDPKTYADRIEALRGAAAAGQ